ncbi:unnamed protein product [Prorocentrum cordatum]|uniref:Uncharacterized protein n=1 Tax=Prorocentrum cordatum TaxID=2364126 RepID=A0ABN9TC12_9DINO|nr:unnamed protein product [Polarella glacialis]
MPGPSLRPRQDTAAAGSAAASSQTREGWVAGAAREDPTAFGTAARRKDQDGGHAVSPRGERTPRGKAWPLLSASLRAVPEAADEDNEDARLRALQGLPETAREAALGSMLVGGLVPCGPLPEGSTSGGGGGSSRGADRRRAGEQPLRRLALDPGHPVPRPGASRGRLEHVVQRQRRGMPKGGRARRERGLEHARLRRGVRVRGSSVQLARHA